MGLRPPVLIGEAPTDDANDALTGTVGRRMAALAGLSYQTYLERTVRMNLFDRPVEKWNGDLARSRADDIRYLWLTVGDRVVLLGARVAHAFGAERAPLYEWQTDGVVRYVRLPHPSGRNRLLNDHDHREKTGAVLREAVLA